MGTQSLATFRVTAWFAPDDAPMVFAERDIDLFWAYADPPADPVGMARPGSSTA